MTKYTEELSYHRCLPVPLFITTLPNPVGTTSMSDECQGINERPTSSALGDDTTDWGGLSSLPLLVDWSVGDDTPNGGGLSSLPLLVDRSVGDNTADGGWLSSLPFLVDGTVGVGGEVVHCKG